jgi:hypothetical protein
MRREKLRQKATLGADMHDHEHGCVQVLRESGKNRSQRSKAAERCSDNDDVTMAGRHVEELHILSTFLRT